MPVTISSSVAGLFVGAPTLARTVSRGVLTHGPHHAAHTCAALVPEFISSESVLGILDTRVSVEGLLVA